MRSSPVGAKLAAVVLAAFAIRFAVSIYVAPYPDRFIFSDAVGYDQIARNLVAGKGFSIRSDFPYVPDNFRTPGYPAVLAAVYGLFGHRPEFALYLQAIAGALTCVIAFAVGTSVANKGVGLVAASLLAINPHSITYSSLLWSDAIYALVLATATLLMILALCRDRLWIVILAGFTLGVATLVHPRSFLLVVLPIGFLLISRFRAGSFWGGLVQGAAYLVFFLLPLMPWIFRNYVTFGVPNLTSAAGKNMLFYGAALTRARRTGEDQWEVAKNLEAEINDQAHKPLNEAEFANLALRKGLELISTDPASYGAVQLIGTAKVFMPGTFSLRRLLTGTDSPSDKSVYELLISTSVRQDAILRFIRETPTSILAIVFLETALLIAMLAAWPVAVLRGPRSQIQWIVLLSLIVLYLALVAGPAGAPRFRVALMPMLTVLAAIGFQPIAERLGDQYRRTNLSVLLQRPRQPA